MLRCDLDYSTIKMTTHGQPYLAEFIKGLKLRLKEEMD